MKIKPQSPRVSMRALWDCWTSDHWRVCEVWDQGMTIIDRREPIMAQLYFETRSHENQV